MFLLAKAELPCLPPAHVDVVAQWTRSAIRSTVSDWRGLQQ